MKPLVKWVGGKTQLLSEIKARIPSTWNKETDGYVEPFFGGGALFFDLEPKNAILADHCAPLIEFYRAVMLSRVLTTERLCAWAQIYNALSPVEQEQFYLQRRHDFNQCRQASTADRGSVAANFYFLNKIGFNGLYRENSSGVYNVPWGKRKKFNFDVDQEAIFSAASALLRQQKLLLPCPYSTLRQLSSIQSAPNSLVYCDPPYLDTFSNYNGGGFDFADHLRLALWATDLREAGHSVILSNAHHPDIVTIYKRLGWRIDVVEARRNVNSDGAGRGAVKECLIY